MRVPCGESSLSPAIVLFIATLMSGWKPTLSAKKVWNEQSTCRMSGEDDNLFQFNHTDLNGKATNFKEFAGQITLVVNVASFWVYTVTSYTQLNALHAEYGTSDGDSHTNNQCKLRILGFPSNQFGHQEPGTESEILNCLRYVRPGKGYRPKFKMFSKLYVNGEKESMIFKWLKNLCPAPTDIIVFKDHALWKPIRSTDIQWNFEKFLVDHNGQPYKRYSEQTEPNTIMQDVHKLMTYCRKVCKNKHQPTRGQATLDEDKDDGWRR